ncbi:MAG: 7-carboxy-7-deazaguanine synthase QueE [Phycisphaerales bacterium JB037]
MNDERDSRTTRQADLPLPVRRDPPESTSDTLPISESFLSIQGEGRLTGVPSWFVRLAGCNLRCTWCDTPYASWAPESSPRSIASLIEEARATGVRHAVVTGGEPMIFERTRDLCARLRDAGFHITIETAGTVDLDACCDLLSLSPKLANSTPRGDPRDPTGAWAARHESRRLNHAALQGLIDRARGTGAAVQVKFVVASPADLAEIDTLLEPLSGWSPDDIMLMPEGVSIPEPASVGWVVEECLRRGWRYCHRLHIELFGDTRGT